MNLTRRAKRLREGRDDRPLFVWVGYCVNGWRVEFQWVGGRRALVGGGSSARAALRDAERRLALDRCNSDYPRDLIVRAGDVQEAGGK